VGITSEVLETIGPMNVPPGGRHRPTRRIEVKPHLALRVIDHRPVGSLRPVEGNTAPTIVMLHGLSSNAEMWNGVGDSLAASGYSSIAIDQRGHGLSDKPDGPYDMATVTDDLLALLEAEQIDRPVLAGQSWGANVVMEFAARFPGKARGIVPVDGGFIDLAASFPDWTECERVMAPPRLAGTPAAQLRSWMRSSHPDWSPEAIEAMMGFAEVDPDGIAAPWLSFENHIKVLRGLWEHRPLDRYVTVTDPVWWIVAEPKVGAVGWTGRKRPALDAVNLLLPRTKTTWMVGDHDLHAQHPHRVAGVIVEAIEMGFFA
jgi:pimeloyl-ACP methyl ester carboxylesterase